MHAQKLTHYSLTHLSDPALVRELEELVSEDRATLAGLLAHLGEVDARRLYVPAGHSSMFAYCVEALRFSEDAAYRRIRAARAARQFPCLFDAVADGRLHLAAVCVIAPHLTEDNADELIDAATHKKKAEVEEWVARRFSDPWQPDPPSRVRAIPPVRVGSFLSGVAERLWPMSGPSHEEFALGQVGVGSGEAQVASGEAQLVPGRVDSLGLDGELGGNGGDLGRNGGELVPGRVDTPRFLVQVTIPKTTHDKLRHAQALLSHSIPAGDLAKVLDRALDALIAQLEKRRLGAGTRRHHARSAAAVETASDAGATMTPADVPPSAPDTSQTPPDPDAQPTPSAPAANDSLTQHPRHYIQLPIRRAVWERDQGQCTYTSPEGHRCTARRLLEFDHVQPVARGGEASVEGLRLRCRAHNQYEAEQTYGAAFMKRKRDGARDKQPPSSPVRNNSPPSA